MFPPVGSVTNMQMRKFWSRWRRYNAPKAFLIGLGLLVLSISIEYMSVTAIYRQEVSKDWPTTPATLESVRTSFTRGYGFYTGVEYTYAVKGETYHDYTWDLPHLSYKGLRQTLSRGEHIAVHYNPQQPSISILDPGFPWGRTTYTLLVPPPLTLLGLLVVAGAFGELRKKLGKRRQRTLPGT
jgi:hypothetical protein